MANSETGPNNLLAASSFVTLGELCQAEYGGGKPVFALSAANAIDEAYKRKTTLRRHLCPLDLADELPSLSFGNARVAEFSADDLAACSTRHA